MLSPDVTWIGSFLYWMFGMTGMPVKRDHVCYSTQSLVDSLAETLEGLQITPTSSKVSVFTCADKITIILTSRQKEMHYAVPMCCRCYSQTYKVKSPTIGQMEHCPWDQSLGHSLRIRSENVWCQIPCDYRGDDLCAWSSIVTRLRNSPRMARLRDLNVLQHVRYVNICQLWRLL
jgi:hypothetical protein